MNKYDIHWNNNLENIIDFLEKNKRFPLHSIESERQLSDWLRNNISRYNCGKLDKRREQILESYMPTIFKEKLDKVATRFLCKNTDLVNYLDYNDIEKLQKLNVNSLQDILNVYKTKLMLLRNKDTEYNLLSSITGINTHNTMISRQPSKKYRKLWTALYSLNRHLDVCDIRLINNIGLIQDDASDENIIQMKNNLCKHRDDVLSRLNNSEQEILINRVYKLMTQQEVADMIGKSKNSLYQIEVHIYRKLRHPKTTKFIR